ncbi:slit homolog 1 protein-like [Mytilus californianus]|uniref:slit homolog 1 protein-like n=1 Tax=Mytilus californianus TaxID=6549 RepID=UPI0022470B5C|nr:slit homolog 1 protein-like [Mytilus californianus]
MGYLQEVTFSFCNIVSLTSGMLSPFGTLNSLRFEGGSIASYSSDFLTGLIVEPVTTTPEPKGELVIKDCTITPTSIPAGTFDALTTVKSIRVENAGVTAIDSSLYNLAVAVDDLSLADNSITTLDSAIFSSLKGLSDINLDGIPYDCSCTSLAFLQAVSQNSIRSAGPICNSPAAYQNKKATKYYTDSCATSVSCADIAIGSTCMTVYELVGSVLSFVTLVIAAIALVIICHTRRQLMTATSNLEKNRNSGWSKAKDVMGTNRSVKPPMKGSQAVHGWA